MGSKMSVFLASPNPSQNTLSIISKTRLSTHSFQNDGQIHISKFTCFQIKCELFSILIDYKEVTHLKDEL